MTTDHFGTVLIARSVTDRNIDTETDGACDPWCIRRAAWKFEDYRLKWRSNAKIGAEPGAGVSGCAQTAVIDADIPVGVGAAGIAPIAAGVIG